MAKCIELQGLGFKTAKCSLSSMAEYVESQEIGFKTDCVAVSMRLCVSNNHHQSCCLQALRRKKKIYIFDMMSDDVVDSLSPRYIYQSINSPINSHLVSPRGPRKRLIEPVQSVTFHLLAAQAKDVANWKEDPLGARAHGRIWVGLNSEFN